MVKDDMTLQEKLDAINAAIAEANGDTEKETALVTALIDPQDANNCEGCQ